MKTTDFLMQEHKLILRTLNVLDAMSPSAETTGVIEQHDVHEILEFLRWFADSHHQVKEETILFPALMKEASAQQRAVEHLMTEHGHERALLESIETELRLARLSEFAACAGRLSSALRNHVYKEDHILFEQVDEFMSAEGDEALLDALKSFETAFDRETLEKKLTGLRALEWKYLRK